MTNSDPKLSGTVYVIGSPESTLVKIGYSTHAPGRIVAIQTMSPLPLKLLWQTAGTYQLESGLHAHFSSKRKHGEWFDFGAEDPLPLIEAAVVEVGEAIRARRLLDEQEADRSRKRMDLLRRQKAEADSHQQPVAVKQAAPAAIEKRAAPEPAPEDPIRIAGQRIEREQRERGVYMCYAEVMAAGAESLGDTKAVAYWLSIKAIVDKAPPLSSEQKARLRVLLQPAPQVPPARSARKAKAVTNARIAPKPEAPAASFRLIDHIGVSTPQ